MDVFEYQGDVQLGWGHFWAALARAPRTLIWGFRHSAW